MKTSANAYELYYYYAKPKSYKISEYQLNSQIVEFII